MTLGAFKESLSKQLPPGSINKYLQALWYDAKGDWEKAHLIVQEMNDSVAAWIHAYLHRKEGDMGNADYWYRLAGKRRPSASLEQEWEAISLQLIKEDQ